MMIRLALGRSARIKRIRSLHKAYYDGGLPLAVKITSRPGIKRSHASNNFSQK